MMKLILPALGFVAFTLIFVSCSTKGEAPPTASKLDKKRYAGVWHEIARLPHRFEKGLVAATATYGVNEDGTISVRNDGRKADGATTSIIGTAKPAKEGGDPGKLLVRFEGFPVSLFAGDYWILDIDPAYRHALVGSPNKKFLWLLSKDPTAGRADFERQIAKAKELGFDTSELYFNPQRISD